MSFTPRVVRDEGSVFVRFRLTLKTTLAYVESAIFRRWTKRLIIQHSFFRNFNLSGHLKQSNKVCREETSCRFDRKLFPEIFAISYLVLTQSRSDKEVSTFITNRPICLLITKLRDLLFRVVISLWLRYFSHWRKRKRWRNKNIEGFSVFIMEIENPIF